MAARSLCRPCWQHLRNTGALTDYERLTRSRDELLHEYAHWRTAHYDYWESRKNNWQRCADWLGMTYTAFERAMLRARRDGDPRAALTGETWNERRVA